MTNVELVEEAYTGTRIAFIMGRQWVASSDSAPYSSASRLGLYWCQDVAG